MKNSFVLTLSIIILAVILSGCGSQQSLSSNNSKATEQPKATTDAKPAETKAPEKIKIGATIISAQHAFFVDVINGLKEEAQAKGVEINVVDANTDITKQTNQIRDFIQQKVSALIVYGVDPKAVVPATEEAIKAGIPVITVDMKLDTDKVATFIGTDNFAAGKKAGEYASKYIKEKLNGKANIGVVIWKSSVAQQDRMKGFVESVTKDNPNVKMVAELPGYDRATSLNSTQSMLQSNPNLDMIFATNEGGVLGAMNALEIGKNTKVKLVGFDITKEVAKAIDEEKVLATVAQQPKKMGQLSVNSALDIIKGKKLDAITPLDAELVTKENVAQYK